MKKIASSIVLAFIGALIALGINSILNNSIQNNDVPYQEEGFFQLTGNTASAGFDLTIPAERSINTVVHVMTKSLRNANNFYGFFLGDGGQYPVIGSGSGVIISSDGYIVTNNHVIAKSENIQIVLNDKRSYKAEVIGTDPTTDLALLKINAKNLDAIVFGDSDALKVGEWVLAVGNPFNLTSTVTAGIVSAKGRNISLLNKEYAIESFIQTDAAVNPGNSGGALVNINGSLIGINTAIASKTGSYTGYSFAVPVNIVKKVVADLKEFGTVQRALLGISISEIDANIAKRIGSDKIEGVYIESVFENGAASNADIRSGDVILKIGGVAINKVSELQERVSTYRPGDKTEVTIKRNNQTYKIEVLFKNRMGNTDIITRDITTILGAEFVPIESRDKSILGITYGMKIFELSAGKLMKAGVQKGFIITSINHIPIKEMADIKKALSKSNGGVLISGIYPNGETAYYAFGLK